MLFPIRSSPMPPNQSAAVHGRGHFCSTRSTETIYMHLQTPRPLASLTVTDMSLVISSLHPQIKRNGRKCQLRHPIGNNGAQTTTPKKQGAVANPPPHGLPDYERSECRSAPSDGLDSNSMSFLLYASSPQSTSITPSTSRRSRTYPQGAG